MRSGDTRLHVQPSVCVCLALSVMILPIHWVIAWIIAIAAHECGHLIAIKACNRQILCIHITMHGAVITAENMTATQQIISVLAGPLGGLLLLFISRWFPLIAVCGCIQSVYNLLPLEGFDGGRMLYEILACLIPTHRARKTCLVLDRITRIVLCLFGFLLAWKFAWLAAGVFGLFVLLEKRHRKTPCKPLLQRVQYHQT